MLTVHQENIIANVVNRHQTTAVSADPGTGKSHVLRETCKRLSNNPQLALAFGKANAESLKVKLVDHPNVTVSTIHSAAFRSLRGKHKVDASKYVKLARSAGVTDYSDQVAVADTIDYLQASLVGIDSNLTDSAIESSFTAVTDSLIEEYQGDGPNLKDVIWKLFESPDRYSITFTEMLYWSIGLGRFPSYDTVLLDECQDQSHLMRRVLKHIVGKSKFLAVGDPKQSIMGFIRGSDTKSFQNLVLDFDIPLSNQLSLTESFRCPPVVCEAASEIYPGITSLVTTHTGSVADLPLVSFYSNLPMSNDTMVLSRTNKDLFKLYRRYVSSRIPFRCYGDYGKRLIQTVNRITKGLKSNFVSDFIKECQARLEKDQMACDGKPFTYKQAVTEKWDTLISLAEGLYTVEELTSLIHSIIKSGSSTVGPLLCTAHRAKGLEAQHVYILNPSLFPHPKADTDEELVQEFNLKYVAYTRSLDTLTFLT